LVYVQSFADCSYYVFPCLLTGHMQNRGGKGA